MTALASVDVRMLIVVASGSLLALAFTTGLIVGFIAGRVK
jgi:hypothetical protein